MSLSPVIGQEVPEAANGVATPDSPDLCSVNAPYGPAPGSTPLQQPLKCGGRVPCPTQDSENGSLGETINCLDGETACEGDGYIDTAAHNSHTDTQSHTTSSNTPAQPSATCTADTETCTPPTDTPLSPLLQSDEAPSEFAQSHTGLPPKEPSPLGSSLGAERQHKETEPTDTDSCCSEGDGSRGTEGEKEKQDEEGDEKKEREERYGGGSREAEEDDSEPVLESTAAASAPPPPLAPPPAASESSPCPPHVMAQVRVRNVPERERLARADCSGPIYRGRGSLRRPADIPPIDPAVLLDLERHTQEVAHRVEVMMRSLNGTIQNMTALSVGYIQTYRDSVDSLGESVDMSIKGMYTLMARCEELDRSMQPIHSLAAQIRDIKRTLDALEAICK